MSRTPLASLVLLLASLTVGAACNGAKKVGTTPDGAAEAGAGIDTAPDLAPDLVPDLAPEVQQPTDAGTDAQADAPTDAQASPDAADASSSDTSPDVAATPDAGPDADPACQTIPTTATRTTHLRITTDNECEVFVNGTSVGVTTNWGAPVTIDVSLFVHPGRKNVVAVRGTNTSSQGGNDRGIIGQLTVDADGGATTIVVTDAAWRVSGTEMTGWTALEFNDAGWAVASEIATNGDGPWGAVFGTSAAKWIWLAPVPANTTDKPNVETTYARRTFYFSTDGTTVINQPACP